MPSETARIVLYDIEATHLKADFGHALCFGYKLLGGETQCLSIMDYKGWQEAPWEDARLMRDVHRVLTDEADIIVSFYGKEYDRKFLNTRMMMAGLTPLPPLSSEHVDLYFTARGNMALTSNRLANVARVLGCPFSKTALDGPTWIKASAGHAPSIAYVIEHCKRDVDVLEWCYLALRPYVRQHPRVDMEDATTCRVCGDTALQRRGFAVLTGGRRKVRLQCMNCGAWSTEAE